MESHFRTESHAAYHSTLIDAKSRKRWLSSSMLCSILEGDRGDYHSPAKNFGHQFHALVEADLRRRPGLLLEAPLQQREAIDKFASRWEGKGRERLALLPPKATKWQREVAQAACEGRPVVALPAGEHKKMRWMLTGMKSRLDEYRKKVPPMAAIEQSVYVRAFKRPKGLDGWQQRIADAWEALGMSVKARADYMHRVDGGWEWVDWKTTTLKSISSMRKETYSRRYFIKALFQAMAYTMAGRNVVKLRWVYVPKSSHKPLDIVIDLTNPVVGARVAADIERMLPHKSQWATYLVEYNSGKSAAINLYGDCAPKE